MSKRTKIFIWIGVGVLVVIFLPWIVGRYVNPIKRPPTPASVAATPQPSITTTSGNGTTVTYQATESTSDEQGTTARSGESSFFASPSEQRPGGKVRLTWNVPGAEEVKVEDRSVTSPAGSEIVEMPQAGYTLTVTNPDGSTKSVVADSYSFHLEARVHGSTEPVKLQVNVKLAPREAAGQKSVQP